MYGHTEIDKIAQCRRQAFYADIRRVRQWEGHPSRKQGQFCWEKMFRASWRR